MLTQGAGVHRSNMNLRWTQGLWGQRPYECRIRHPASAGPVAVEPPRPMEPSLRRNIDQPLQRLTQQGRLQWPLTRPGVKANQQAKASNVADSLLTCLFLIHPLAGGLVVGSGGPPRRLTGNSAIQPWEPREQDWRTLAVLT